MLQETQMLDCFTQLKALPKTTRCLALLITLASSSLGLLPPAHSLPARSTTVAEKGMMMVDSPLPWVSGWNLQGAATNVMTILQRLEVQNAKGAYLLLCATWSSACGDSLQVIQQQSGRLQAEDINVIVVFLEDNAPMNIQQWVDKLGVTYNTTIRIIIDRYHRSAIRLGAYEEHIEEVELPITPPIGEEALAKPLTERKKVKRLRVPLGVVLSMSGRVLSIITQEGSDLIDNITKTIRYAGE